MASLSHISRVLLMEDEALIALDVEMALRDAGVSDIVTAFTTDEALGALDQHTICAAILDIHVGQTESYDVARRLRGRGIPFVFSTGTSAELPEFDDVPLVLKPYSSDAIVEALSRVTGPSAMA